jgi:hypothetical protein
MSEEIFNSVIFSSHDQPYVNFIKQKFLFLFLFVSSIKSRESLIKSRISRTTRYEII